MIKDYELNVLDECRIKPLLKQIQLSDIKPKFFLSSVYPTRTSYESVQKHNKEVRRTIRNFYKSDIRMIFFIEKHLDPESQNFLGFHRHVLIEDAPEERWKSPAKRMKEFLLNYEPETYFALTLGNGISEQGKIDLLMKVLNLVPFLRTNKEAPLHIEPIDYLEGVVAYCTKQFEWVLPSYEIIDPVSSDVDVSFYLIHKQDGTEWQTRKN